MQFGTNDKAISQKKVMAGLKWQNNLHNGKIRPNLPQNLSQGGRGAGRKGKKRKSKARDEPLNF